MRPKNEEDSVLAVVVLALHTGQSRRVGLDQRGHHPQASADRESQQPLAQIGEMLGISGGQFEVCLANARTPARNWSRSRGRASLEPDPSAPDIAKSVSVYLGVGPRRPLDIGGRRPQTSA